MLEDAARVGFANGMRITMLTGVAIAVLAGLLALRYLPARGRRELAGKVFVPPPLSPASSEPIGGSTFRSDPSHS